MTEALSPTPCDPAWQGRKDGALHELTSLRPIRADASTPSKSVTTLKATPSKRESGAT